MTRFREYLLPRPGETVSSVSCFDKRLDLPLRKINRSNLVAAGAGHVSNFAVGPNSISCGERQTSIVRVSFSVLRSTTPTLLMDGRATSNQWPSFVAAVP